MTISEPNTHSGDIPPIRITDLIHFHGLTLLVYSDGEHSYIQAKPLVDMAGIDWRKARRTIATEDNAILYGTVRLHLPEPNLTQGHTSDPLNSKIRLETATQGEPRSPLKHHLAVETEPSATEGTLCFRLDRARMFLARINTSHMKAQGNQAAAEALLALQIEWAEVIHAYETHGIAVKKDQNNPLNDLSKLMKLRSQAHKGPEQVIITQLIHQQLADMGHPIPNEPDLFSQT